MSQTLNVAAPPLTTDTATRILSDMAALTGTPTDFNPGSQIRTFSEATGSVTELEGVATVARALAAMVTSAMSAYGITPNPAQPGQGVVTFSTGPGNPPATQDIAIPAGTIVQTSGGIQFATTADATLLQGQSSVTVGVQAVQGGVAGNVQAGAITVVASSLGYQLFITNAAPTSGGVAAEQPSQTLARLAALQASLGLSSPVAVANAPIGVTVSGSGETCLYAACYEPWLAAGSGAGSGTAGFTVYVDNGTGTASSALLAAVTNKLNGNQALGQSGNRPAGVPYSVQAASGVLANVVISGTLAPLAPLGTIEQDIIQGVTNYFSLGFGQDALQPQIAAVASNAALGFFSALSVNLYYAAAPSTPVPLVSGGAGYRVLLSSLTVNISGS